MENGKGKSEVVEGESSNGLWAGSFKKKGSVIPKKRRPVSHMVGEKIGKAVVSGVQKINNKKKINPDDVAYFGYNTIFPPIRRQPRGTWVYEAMGTSIALYQVKRKGWFVERIAAIRLHVVASDISSLILFLVP
ncbi:hypothetical protein ACH5RR_026459 [Cinchona calisaya]|uniref:Uncharacterized protein n=1 Tax=Cinchona calisaya TaxID=153742 RepID=A0ABD2Z5U1_9GENT